MYRSLIKYGCENHIIEIIEECDEKNLNEREIYWIEFYKSCYKKYPNGNGLNWEEGGNKPPITYGRKLTEKKIKSISEKNKKNHADKRISGILQFDMGGNLIKEWDSLVDIQNNLGYISDIISLVCRNKYKYNNNTYKNYIWEFKN